LNTAVTLPLAGHAAASAEQATACTLNQLTFGSGDHGPVHDQQHDEGQPRLEHLAAGETVPLHLPGLLGIHRDAAVAENGLRLPDLQQHQQRRKAYDRARDVGQVGPEVAGHGVLPGDIAEGADHRERPRTLHALLAGHQIQQHPRRQQREHRHDRADRAGEGE